MEYLLNLPTNGSTTFEERLSTCLKKLRRIKLDPSGHMLNKHIIDINSYTKNFFDSFSSKCVNLSVPTKTLTTPYLKRK